MPRELERIEKTSTKSGKLRARCPDHNIVSHTTVGATEAGPLFECPGYPGDPMGGHLFVRPWATGERLGA